MKVNNISSVRRRNLSIISLESIYWKTKLLQEIKNIKVKTYYKEMNRDNFVIHTFKINSFELAKLIKQVPLESNQTFKINPKNYAN